MVGVRNLFEVTPLKTSVGSSIRRCAPCFWANTSATPVGVVATDSHQMPTLAVLRCRIVYMPYCGTRTTQSVSLFFGTY